MFALRSDCVRCSSRSFPATTAALLSWHRFPSSAVLYYFLAGVGSLSILPLLLFLCVEKSLKRLCVVKKFVVQDVLGWRGSRSQVTGARWMRLDCIREFYLRSILFVFSWDFCVVCYFILVKERLFCEMLLWWRIFCPSRYLATLEVELLVSRDSILLLFHVHFVVYMVDHAFQNASQCSGRSVVILSSEQNPLSFDRMSSS